MVIRPCILELSNVRLHCCQVHYLLSQWDYIPTFYQFVNSYLWVPFKIFFFSFDFSCFRYPRFQRIIWHRLYVWHFFFLFWGRAVGNCDQLYQDKVGIFSKREREGKRVEPDNRPLGNDVWPQLIFEFDPACPYHLTIDNWTGVKKRRPITIELQQWPLVGWLAETRCCTITVLLPLSSDDPTDR